MDYSGVSTMLSPVGYDRRAYACEEIGAGPAKDGESQQKHAYDSPPFAKVQDTLRCAHTAHTRCYNPAVAQIKRRRFELLVRSGRRNCRHYGGKNDRNAQSPELGGMLSLLPMGGGDGDTRKIVTKRSWLLVEGDAIVNGRCHMRL